MAGTGDDSMQLPGFEISPEPPFGTAMEDHRTRLHKLSVVPSTFGLTETDQLLTNPSAFGDDGDIYDDHDGPSFGFVIPRPESLENWRNDRIWQCI